MMKSNYREKMGLEIPCGNVKREKKTGGNGLKLHILLRKYKQKIERTQAMGVDLTCTIYYGTIFKIDIFLLQCGILLCQMTT